VLRLGLIAAGREALEGGAAQQAHAVLRIAYAPARHELEEQARESIGDPAMRGHRGEVAEAVADHELGLAPRGHERRDRGGRMLAVGVDHEDRRGTAGDVIEARADCGPLAALPRQARQL
jgi:hypothetical protein